MAQTQSISVGMLALDPGWIAGTLYIGAAARALQHANGGNDIRLKLIAPRGMDLSHFSQFIDAFDEVHRFDLPRALESRSWRRIKLRQLVGGIHLRKIIRNHVDVVFPIRRQLGFPVPTPAIGWIPDCQHARYPQFFSEKECRQRDAEFRNLAENCTQLLVSSHDARSDLLRIAGMKNDNVGVYRFRTFPEPDWFSADAADIARRYDLPEKFLYFPSQQWKHKNHVTLLRALKHVTDRNIGDIALVLTGRDSDYRHPDHGNRIKAFIDENGLRSRVHWLGVLQRQEQIQLMRQAAAIVRPSLFEGWSMLVEDCRAIGKEAFVSDIAVHREQAYRHAHYFNPDSADALADLIMKRWPVLKAGPDPVAEASAREDVTELCRENGNLLISIFEKAMASTTGRR
ncbi:glycosyltransferase family 4 protein [Hoeflea poritis]|uniref:Glycosyltransferase family 1 protein n=1 Tax=Hoeflea poritis TaxID=2993659 RepID=A0ABT4VS64_9HYPH|nr:glycosyltransferase family 1 protein [Hoeflea poritis]MDA4847546.1 glycosyltransferase family 1 protein [Hoeflea poritis]